MWSVLGIGNGYIYLSNQPGKRREVQCVILRAYVLRCYLPPPYIAWKVLAEGMFSK